MNGLVVKNTGSWYVVRTDEGELVQCKIKGNFRLRGIRSTNPVAIGDRVVIEETSHLNTYFITEIEERRNYIIRRSQNLSKQSHILAANVDQAMLVVTVYRPQTSTTFIDRFLASAEAYRIPVILLFNKTDLLDNDLLIGGQGSDMRHYQQMMVRLYETVGYECRQISATTGLGIEELRPLLKGKITLLSGNSGVGKSTLINRLVPGLNLRTAEISDAHNLGMHTTTFSEMISIDPSPVTIDDSKTPKETTANNGQCSYLIDTPGIKGFGTFDIEPEELSSYFREIFHFAKDCRFSNCSHTHEPGCAVLKALDEHLIAQSRYQSYLSMLNDKDEGKYREAY